MWHGVSPVSKHAQDGRDTGAASVNLFERHNTSDQTDPIMTMQWPKEELCRDCPATEAA